MRRTISVLSALVTVLLMAGLIEWVQLATPNPHAVSSPARALRQAPAATHPWGSLDGRNTERIQAVAGPAPAAPAQAAPADSATAAPAAPAVAVPVRAGGLPAARVAAPVASAVPA